jgi:hypothetical protein
MDTAVKPVQNGRGRRRRWSAEQKLTVLQEGQTGIPLEEICRKYAMLGGTAIQDDIDIWTGARLSDTSSRQHDFDPPRVPVAQRRCC